MNPEFLQTLSSVNRVLYKSSYEFHMKHEDGATHESAHQAGLKKLKRVNALLDQQVTWVDVTTGETHKANY